MSEPLNLTTAYSSFHIWEIHLAQHVLEQAGIETHIVDENMIRMHWLHANAIGGVKLQVPGRDAEKTKQILRDMTQSNPLPKQTDCPQCLSLKAKYVRWHWLYVLTTMLTLGVPLFFRRVQRCPKCGRSTRVY